MYSPQSMNTNILVEYIKKWLLLTHFILDNFNICLQYLNNWIVRYLEYRNTET